VSCLNQANTLQAVCTRRQSDKVTVAILKLHLVPSPHISTCYAPQPPPHCTRTCQAPRYSHTLQSSIQGSVATSRRARRRACRQTRWVPWGSLRSPAAYTWWGLSPLRSCTMRATSSPPRGFFTTFPAPCAHAEKLLAYCHWASWPIKPTLPARRRPCLTDTGINDGVAAGPLDQPGLLGVSQHACKTMHWLFRGLSGKHSNSYMCVLQGCMQGACEFVIPLQLIAWCASPDAPTVHHVSADRTYKANLSTPMFWHKVQYQWLSVNTFNHIIRLRASVFTVSRRVHMAPNIPCMQEASK
jgi:hypothetical protein